MAIREFFISHGMGSTLWTPVKKQ